MAKWACDKKKDLPPPKDKALLCVWEYDDLDDEWSSQCANKMKDEDTSWQMKCPFCGKEIEAVEETIKDSRHVQKL